MEEGENISPVERVLVQLMRRNFSDLRSSVLDYRASGEGSDDLIAASIQAALDQADRAVNPFDSENDFLFQALYTALIDEFFAAMSLFSLAIERGERALLDQALEKLGNSFAICSELNLLPQWWFHQIAVHLLLDLWSSTFHEKLPLQPKRR